MSEYVRYFKENKSVAVILSLALISLIFAGWLFYGNNSSASQFQGNWTCSDWNNQTQTVLSYNGSKYIGNCAGGRCQYPVGSWSWQENSTLLHIYNSTQVPLFTTYKNSTDSDGVNKCLSSSGYYDVNSRYFKSSAVSQACVDGFTTLVSVDNDWVSIYRTDMSSICLREGLNCRNETVQKSQSEINQDLADCEYIQSHVTFYVLPDSTYCNDYEYHHQTKNQTVCDSYRNVTS